MSGDVQPRKRKDKKRKRDDDESSHGVHITKMGSDDVHLHVQHDHGTGGHWCAKILFFSLLAVLLGLVGLIILENRGLSDLDTPLSESRFSNYFDGWVEEHRQEHDDHDPVQASIEEHDEHGEPFEEEEEDEEGDEDDDDDDDNEHADDDDNDDDDENDEEDDEDDDDKVEAEDEDEDTKDETQEVKDDNDDDDDEVDDDDDDDEQDITAEDNDNEDTTEVNEKTIEDNKDDDDDDDNNDDGDEENNDNDDDDDNDDNSQNKNDDDDDDNDNDDDDKDVDDDVSAPIKSTTLHSHNVGSKQQQANTEDDDDDEDDDPFDEEDDDGTFESMETVVDNDAEEISLLQEKARQQAAEAAKNAPPSAEDDTDDPAENVPSWASSLAVKIGVGVALALVARIVLLRKNPNATDEPIPEVLMKRRLTIATAEDTFPEDEDVPPLPTEDEELLGEEEEEEIVVEEEIEYIETDDEDTPIQNIGTSKHQQKRYMPETFEELNAMYKPNTAGKSEETGLDVIYRKSPSLSPSSLKTDVGSASVEVDPEPVLGVKNAPENMTLYDARPNTSVATGAIPKVDKNKEATYAKGTTREVTHDMDYQPEDEDIDYDIDDDVYEEEEVVEEEDEIEEDDDANGEGDVSDFDDEELMNRLEMKYGKLPQREHEYESDEDPDDPTWTQIKPKEARGGGPQVDANLDMFEQELRRANEEMLREFNYL